jgi:hypothetical protein
MPSTVGYAVEPNKLRSKQWKEAVQTARQKLVYGADERRSKREDRWVQSERQYEGLHWDSVSDDGNSDLIVVNMSFSTVQVILPYMTGTEPRFLVAPYSGDASTKNAAIQQALLNNLWRSRQVSGMRHTKQVAWDYLVYGDGYLKVGYSIEDKRTDESTYAEVAKLWIARVNPWDLWMDPSADGIHNARWVCQRLWLTRDELTDNKLYSNVNDTNVAYGTSRSVADVATRRDVDAALKEVFDGSEFAVLYEFYDLVKMRMITYSTGELPLRVVEDIGSCPIVQLGNYRLPGTPYHMGELEQVWELQVELNKTRSHLITHRKRNVAKLFARRNSLEQDAIDALQSQVVNDVAFVEGDVPIDQLVKPIDLPNLSADVYNVSEVIQNDIYEITGVNEYLRGAGPNIRRTATEASIIEGATNIKSQFKLSQIEEALREVGALMLGTAKDVFPRTEYDELQLFLTGREAEAVQRADMNEQSLAAEQSGNMAMLSQLQQIAGRPMDVTVTPSPDIFQGEYEVDVESHSTEMRNPVLKEQKAREMVELVVNMAPLLAQLGVSVNYKRLIEDWFKVAGVEDVDGVLETSPMMPPPSPAAPPGGTEGPPMDPLSAGPQGSLNTGAAGAETLVYPEV